jgi:hypothetical protein
VGGAGITIHEDSIGATHEISTGSDYRLKTNISYENIQKYYNFFFDLSPAEFAYLTDPNQRVLGFIAQDV